MENEEARASSFIHLRVSPARKAAYVRAAGGVPLAKWIFAHLDKASGFQEEGEGGA